MKKHAIGIDIGGTKISVVLGTLTGKILIRQTIPTLTGGKTKLCVHHLTDTVRAILQGTRIKKQQLAGIGVCAPGAVNSSKGVLPRSPNLPGWTGLQIRAILEHSFNIPVFIANDANAAALGEARFGSGRGAKDFIYVTVSTGIGGGLVMDDDLYEGSGYVAGEIGHMSIVPEGQRCNCGRKGCLEAYASGTAIARYYREKKHKEVGGAKEVGMAARLGDRQALKSYERAAYYLGIGLANLMNVLNPERIVIGGGVLKSVPANYWRSVIRSVKDHAWPEAFRTTKVFRSTILGRSGDLGALALVFKKNAPSRI